MFIGHAVFLILYLFLLRKCFGIVEMYAFEQQEEVRGFNLDFLLIRKFY
jgi:hypothetical protein